MLITHDKDLRKGTRNYGDHSELTEHQHATFQKMLTKILYMSSWRLKAGEETAKSLETAKSQCDIRTEN